MLASGGSEQRFCDVTDKTIRASRAIEVVFDGAHVPFNLAAVMRDLNRQPEFKGPCVAIVALASDKDAAGFLSVLSGHAATIIFTELSTSGRSNSAKDLQAIAASGGSRAKPRRIHSGFSSELLYLRRKAKLGCSLLGHFISSAHCADEQT